MNWYKTSKLNRSEIQSSCIVREILRLVKITSIPAVEVLGDKCGIPGLRVVVLFSPTTVDYVHSSGGVGWQMGKPMVKVQLKIPGYDYEKPIDQKWYEQIDKTLRDTIRHELEHVEQKASGEKFQGYISLTEQASADNVRKYFLNPTEVSAFVSGFYYQAKKTRLTFREVLENHLWIMKIWMEKKGIDMSEASSVIDEIRQKYNEYAKQRFPDAQFEYTALRANHDQLV